MRLLIGEITSGRRFFPFLIFKTPFCGSNRNVPERNCLCSARSAPYGFSSTSFAAALVLGSEERSALDRIVIHAGHSVLSSRTCRHRADEEGRGGSESVITGAYSDPSRSASFGACLPCKMEVHDDPHLTGNPGAVPSHCAAMVLSLIHI